MSTTTFRMNHMVFFKQLSLKSQPPAVAVEEWLERFADMRIEELYYGEELDLIEPVP